MDYSRIPDGQVSPDITALGLIITIHIGRSTGNCTAFGFCGITIEPSASARAIQAAAEWVHGRLQLNFLSDPPDKTNVLTLDQDIVLDSATSRLLGYEHVSLRAGQYPVDYSRIPMGKLARISRPWV